MAGAKIQVLPYAQASALRAGEGKLEGIGTRSGLKPTPNASALLRMVNMADVQSTL